MVASAVDLALRNTPDRRCTCPLPVEKDHQLHILYYISFSAGFNLVGGSHQPSNIFGSGFSGLAIALSDPITNVAGWIFIFWRRPFEVGDRIQIGEHAGDVIDARIFQFTLLEIGNWVDADQSTGRMIHIPNRKIFSDPLANYSKGFQFIWNEIPVLITFESDWRKAKTILNAIITKYEQDFRQDVEQQLQRTAQEFLIYNPITTPIVYTNVKDSGVLLTIRYLCRPHERRSTTEMIWEEILTTFEQQIEIEWPTQRPGFTTPAKNKGKAKYYPSNRDWGQGERQSIIKFCPKD